jgi:hypothetical protein
VTGTRDLAKNSTKLVKTCTKQTLYTNTKIQKHIIINPCFYERERYHDAQLSPFLSGGDDHAHSFLLCTTCLLLECVITPAAGKTSTSANKILKSLKISKTSDGYNWTSLSPIAHSCNDV